MRPSYVYVPSFALPPLARADACVLALQAVLHDDPAVTWLGLQGHCASTTLPLVGPDAALTPAEVFSKQCGGLDRGTFYLA